MYETLLLKIAGLCLYRNILRDRCVQSLVTILKLLQDEKGGIDSIIEAWSGIYTVLLEKKASCIHDYVMELSMHDENAFTLCCERQQADLEGPLVKQAVSDLKVLDKLASIRCSELKKKMKEKARGNLGVYRFIDSLPDWNPEDIPAIQWEREIQCRVRWHEKNGAGLFSKHRFFIWDGENRMLAPVHNPDPITLDKLYLLEGQKEVAVKNTKGFLLGKTANNVLFYGDRGTGKSSMVKALANAFFEDGLRLIEIPKKYLDQIPQITSLLSVRGMKFILFIDDLAFDNNEEKYTALKAALEGGIEHKPSNVLLYATSNRRHLVKESFADRKGIYSDNPDDEIRARDSLQEKLSLADRFGITIIFSSPLKKEYLQFVCKMAEEENIDMDQTLLAQKAMQWEMAYNGMSARTARQFINWLKADKD